MTDRVAIILAAGVSSRMNSQVPKVLHNLCGRTVLSYVLEACRSAGIEKEYVVIGHGAEQVKEQFSADEDIVWVKQEEQKGTAHAVLCCKEHLEDFDGETLVLCGDGPLIRSEMLRALIEKHRAERSAVTLATAILDDPTGYGRISRDEKGNVVGIVEHNDCTDEQLAITEINPSYYLFDNKVLFEAVDKVKPDNAKNEYYLTDAISIIIAAGHKVAAITAVRSEEAVSINTQEQLLKVSKIMQHRIRQKAVKSCDGSAKSCKAAASSKDRIK